MSEINTADKLSFSEVAKRQETKEIVEVMNEHHPGFPYIPSMPANHRFTHKVTRRTSLPSAEWRQLYDGTGTAATTTQVVDFGVGLLEIWSEIDEDLIDTADEPGQTRWNEEKAFAPGMTEQVMDALISGTTTAYPERFDGIQQYLNNLSHTMVQDGGNSGGTSIYIIDVSKCYMIRPKNVGDGGFIRRPNPEGNNTGKLRVTDSGGTDTYMAYVTQFKWWVGWAVENELGMGRVANINATVGGSNTFDENDLIELLNYGDFNPSRTIMLCCKEVLAQMQIKLKDKANVNFSTALGLSGRRVTTFMGCPIFRCDSISTSESTVS